MTTNRRQFIGTLGAASALVFHGRQPQKQNPQRSATYRVVLQAPPPAVSAPPSTD